MKISEAMNDAYMDELLNIEPIEIDTDAITKKTFSKLEISSKAPGRHKFFHTALIAAAIILALSTVVYAGSVIYGMMQQKVDYFNLNPNNSTPVNAPVYHGALEMDIEQFNAAVGATAQAEGTTITLDTVAADNNFINAFFTIVYDEPVDLNAHQFVEDFWPDYYKLRYVIPSFGIKIDGKEVLGGFSTSDTDDPYMADEYTVKTMVRWVCPTILPDVFELNIEGQQPSLNGDVSTETFTFDVTIDKSASAAKTLAAKPGIYSLDTADGQRTLDLNKLAATPFGAVFSVNGHWDGDELNPNPAYLMPEDFYITDDKGNVLNTFWNNVVSSGSPYYALEIIGCAPDAKSITLTPILDKQNYDDTETRTYSLSNIGAKIELDNMGGYYLENYIVEDSRISLVLRPYGRCNYFAGGIVIDTDGVSLAGGRSGLINEQIDRKTGLLTYSISFYAATPEELQKITTFTAFYNGAYELDEGAAITLPLNPNE